MFHKMFHKTLYVYRTQYRKNYIEKQRKTAKNRSRTFHLYIVVSAAKLYLQAFDRRTIKSVQFRRILLMYKNIFKPLDFSLNV